MIHRADRIAERVPIAVALAACVLALCVYDACIIAEPSGALPRLPDVRPTIQHELLHPPTSAVLTTFPPSFTVLVELIDPTVEIVYAAFIDYNPNTGDGLVDQVQHSRPEAMTTMGRTRTLTVNIPMPPDLDRCHVIEVVVALRFESEMFNKGAHTPAPPGGDIATWFYNPTGDLGGCPTLDGGIDARADSEAGDGGVQ